MMNEIPLDVLMDKVDSRYTLVVVAAKRARVLTESQSKEGGGSIKPVSAALKEIAGNRVTYRRIRSGIK